MEDKNTHAEAVPTAETVAVPTYATIDDFAKIEIKVGTIMHAELIEGSDKLIRLEVDFGEKDTEGNARRRQILSGIRAWYSPEQLIGKQCPFVTNLAPRKMKGLFSEGMILAARSMDGEVENLALFHPNISVEPGSDVG